MSIFGKPFTGAFSKVLWRAQLPVSEPASRLAELAQAQVSKSS
jgi:hypothetical protein